MSRARIARSTATSFSTTARLTPLAGSWDQGQNQNTFLIKTDHEISSANRLSLRYNHQNFNGLNFENSGPQNSVEHTGDSNVRTRTFNGSLTTLKKLTLP